LLKTLVKLGYLNFDRRSRVVLSDAQR